MAFRKQMYLDFEKECNKKMAKGKMFERNQQRLKLVFHLQF